VVLEEAEEGDKSAKGMYAREAVSEGERREIGRNGGREGERKEGRKR